MVNDLKHLKEWFDFEVKGEFSLSKVEEKEGLVNTSLSKFVSGERSYLGRSESQIFNWAKRRGYNSEQQYNPIV